MMLAREKLKPQSGGHRRFLRAELLEDRRLLAVATSAGTGVLAQYYSDADLGTFALAQNESSLSLDWSEGAPNSGLNDDSFSARFTGQIEAEFTEAHTFTLNADGGVRLWINGIKQIDQWTSTSVVNAQASVDLISGRRYDLQVEYRETGGDAGLDLTWQSHSLAAQPIPAANLFPSERGSIERRIWTGVVGTDVAALTALAAYPDDPTSVESLPALELGSSEDDEFGDRISGYLHPPVTSQYEFFLAGDEAAELWLSNSSDRGQLQQIALTSTSTAVQDWTATPQQRSGSIELVAGQSYALEVIRKEDTGTDHVAVGWIHSGVTGIEVIDGQYLSPSLPSVQIFTQRGNAIEGDPTPLQFEVTREGPTTNPLTVSYSVRGSATAVDDYSAVSGSVTIPAGASSESISIIPLADMLFEGPENVLVELVDGPRYEVGLRSERQATGVIQDVEDEVPGGTLVTPAFSLADSIAFGGSFSDVIPSSTPFSSVVEAVVPAATDVFNAQLRIPYSAPIEAGDILWADFFVRSTGGGEGQVTAISEESATFTKSLSRSFAVPETWTRLQFPFVSVDSYSPGEAVFGFFLGQQPQTLQFADVRVLEYGPQSDITPNSFQLQNLSDPPGQTFGEFSTVAVAGQPFESAVQIETQVTPPNPWRLQYGGRNSNSVQNGDTLRYSFYARSVAGVSPMANLVIQNTFDFGTLFSTTFELTSTWTLYNFDLTLDSGLNDPDYSVGDLQAALNLGFAPQTVEVAEISWQNLSAIGSLEDFPSLSPSTSYVGRASDSAWRGPAEERIADERQAEITVNVVDAGGSPVDGAIVSIRQTEHDFLFGTAVSAFDNLLSPTGGVISDRYQAEINRLFNTVTIENSLKWPQYVNNVQRGIDAAAWADSNGHYLRGHNIIWPSREQMPDYVWEQYDNLLATQTAVEAEDYLRTEIENRISDVLAQFASEVDEWDIVNEPFGNRDVMDILTDQIVVDWFTQVKNENPNVVRTLNDFNIFTRNGTNTAHREDFESWVTTLSNANVLDVIGVQNHFTEGDLTDIEVLGTLIEDYKTRFNLPIAVTEFDIQSTDRQLQADYLRDYATMIFSQDSISQFVQWGFWENSHWRPEAALFNSDFSLRPHGQVYEDLVFGSWWTDVRGTTRDGSVTAEVFKGDYEISVSIDGQTFTTTVDDFVADGSITITLAGLEWSQPVVNGAEGTTSTVTAVLNEAPTDVVTVALLASAQVEVSSMQLTFDATNWNIPQTVSITPVEDYAIEGSQTEFLSILTSSNDSRFNTSTTSPLVIEFADGLAPLGVSSVTIGDGTDQRSVVKEIAVEFDALATIQDGAFEVQRLGVGEPESVVVTASSTDDGMRTTVALQFSGPLTSPDGGALLDGDYQLIVDASLITLQGTTSALDGDASGSPGGNYRFGATQADDFFALFGDGDGDALVSLLDFALFRQSFGSSVGGAGFDGAFDADGDGAISLLDFAAFRQAFGQTR